ARQTRKEMTLHELLDHSYGHDGDKTLRQRLGEGADPNLRDDGETLLHVAARRRRDSAVAILLEHGADVDARNSHGKTAYTHAIRRGFHEVVAMLAAKGADTTLSAADRFAVAMISGRLSEAQEILARHPACARTGNPEEDRLLADLAGRAQFEPVAFLIEAGADLSAPGLDSGTPLHQSAWFGQPVNARLLLDAGAPLDIFDSIHGSSPIGWAVHGARYSGAAEQRQEAYLELVRMLLDAGSSLHYPGQPDDDAYLRRLRKDATPKIQELLPARI
ncbi:MAG: ankyrin repeat domain-containing protein, partial [Saprospiraceae bacterium]|nr:ankyrin repeat domain-containing protein [Saprospiraceae bacterium]